MKFCAAAFSGKTKDVSCNVVLLQENEPVLFLKYQCLNFAIDVVFLHI